MRWRFEWIWMDMEESLLVCRCLARGSWRQGIGMVGVTRRRRPSPVAILGEGSCGAFPSAFSLCVVLLMRLLLWWLASPSFPRWRCLAPRRVACCSFTGTYGQCDGARAHLSGHWLASMAAGVCLRARDHANLFLFCRCCSWYLTAGRRPCCGPSLV